jgi:diaminohydroxyphosphoribosylaminopyrimidine deaminase/5-amino-6-(5-phosphoribosylamino)uracil reductase
VTPDHAAWMARAVFLAERGRGTTTPNPLVGAVVVTADGIVAGQGAHMVAGGPHAEVVALSAAGAAARGATLYCTLEPCCHVGRTGPCTDRILEAGITRVVTAIEDPNPRVSGGGHTRLRAAGVEVITGVGAGDARRQNAPFLTWITRQRPWTLLKTAVSTDGFVGPHGGQARLTGTATDRWMHRQRAWIDAMVVGADTVLTDDPLLTARGAWRARPLIRVVCDWRGRVPPTARVYSTASAGPVIMVGLETVASAHVTSLRDRGVDVVLMPARDLAAVAQCLARREVQSLLIEGGPVLQQAWIDAGLVDAVQYVWTPVTLGDGVPAAPALQAWAAGTSGRRTTALGVDTLMEGMWP